MEYKFEQRLKQAIAECGNDINISKINKETDLIRDFNFTSIDIIQLVVALETAFGIEIDDQYLVFEKLSPYHELVTMIREKLGE